MSNYVNEEMKQISRWVICKSAKVFDDYGNVIDTLPFGKQTWKIDQKDNMIQILFASTDKKGKLRGWIHQRALCPVRPVDYAMLRYENKTGKRIPASSRYKGQAERWILPGEQVAIRAVVGNWCITNKGWTLFEWLRKCPGDCFDEDLHELLMAVLLQAVKDYQVAINKLRTGKCHSVDDYSRTFGRIDELTRWFTGKQYSLYFEDDGKEKLQWLNESLGVDKKWMKDKRRVYEELRSHGRRRR